ncbi:hypothetical protein ABS71_10625 [bacterium SCN 62-11]|nr:MAG: hypothetical protein ABS71_10625 [bacterium SCN 62-11]
MNQSTSSIQTQNLSQEQASSFALSGRYVAEQVAAGRRLDDVLRDHDSIWFTPNALIPFSQEIFKDHLIKDAGMAPEQVSSFALSGRYVDEQVAAGRHLDDVLREDKSIWRSREALLPFSRAVWAESRTH